MTELGRVREENARLLRRNIELETLLAQSNARVHKWKDQAHRLELRVGRLKKDNHRARMETGAELVRVREELAWKNAAPEVDKSARTTSLDTVLVSRLRQENQDLRDDLERVHQHVQAMRTERDEHRTLMGKIHQENMQFADVLRRFTMKSQIMFRVFHDWNLVLGLLNEWTGGRGQDQFQQEVLGFWAWVHQHHPDLIERGYIDTSLDEELEQVQAEADQ